MPPITQAALDRVLTFLAPLFLQGAGGNPETARQAAHDTLAEYHGRSDQEVRLAALIIAFNLRTLDVLGRAAEPGLDMKIVLRLHGSANALQRAAAQCERTLERLRTAEPAAEADPELLPDSTTPEALRGFIRAMRHAVPADMPLSRQQRREAQRRANKLRQKEQQAALRPRRDAVHPEPAHPEPAMA